MDDSCQAGWLPCARGGGRCSLQLFACRAAKSFSPTRACAARRLFGHGVVVIVLSKIRGPLHVTAA